MADRVRADLAQRLAIYLDMAGREPLYRQIASQLWHEVITGVLETGARLPTVRQLAIDLSISPKTVERAYEELELLGVLTSKQGRGTFVSLSQPNRSELERRSQLERLCRDLIGHAEALDFTVDELIEMLGDLRTSRRDTGAGGG